MTEEVAQVVEEVKVSPIEAEALEMGWRPKEEWTGDEEDFIDARTFVRNKSLFDKIDSLSKRVKDQDKTISMLKEHHSRVEEVTRQQVIKELKAAKKDAYEKGDVDAAIEIDDKIAEQRAIDLYEKSQAKQEQPLHPDFVQWVEKNTWYAQDKELRVEADAIGMAYKHLHPEKNPDEVLAHVSKQIKKLNPEKFENPNRKNTPSVDSGNGKRQTPATKDNYQLSPEEEKIMKNFIRNGVMTKDQYISELRKIKGDN